jgi:hypothetical protein
MYSEGPARHDALGGLPSVLRSIRAKVLILLHRTYPLIASLLRWLSLETGSGGKCGCMKPRSRAAYRTLEATRGNPEVVLCWRPLCHPCTFPDRLLRTTLQTYTSTLLSPSTLFKFKKINTTLAHYTIQEGSCLPARTEGSRSRS